MAENISTIEIKKRKLKEELNSENPRPEVIRRLKESIKRHKEISIHLRNKRMRERKRKSK